MVQPMDLLLVEDNEDDVFMVREAFREEGLDVPMRVARDGEEALALLRGEGVWGGQRLPGLVLMDIQMPRKDGFKLLEAIRADERLRHLPVVVLSTSQREEDVTRSYRCGASSYIAKPASLAELRQIVRRFSVYWVLAARIPEGENHA
ncbi:MAG: response regulator [Planctomycetes bacterium]|nr:response regulator [Planctomycetota bacterium]